MFFLYKLVFYQIYKFYERKGDSYPHIYGWGGTSVIVILHILPLGIIGSLLLFNGVIELNKYLIIPFLIPYFINYFIFLHGKRYVQYLKEVDQKNKRFYGIGFVFYLVALIVINVVLANIHRSIYLESI